MFLRYKVDHQNCIMILEYQNMILNIYYEDRDLFKIKELCEHIMKTYDAELKAVLEWCEKNGIRFDYKIKTK